MINELSDLKKKLEDKTEAYNDMVSSPWGIHPVIERSMSNQINDLNRKILNLTRNNKNIRSICNKVQELLVSEGINVSDEDVFEMISKYDSIKE